MDLNQRVDMLHIHADRKLGSRVALVQQLMTMPRLTASMPSREKTFLSPFFTPSLNCTSLMSWHLSLQFLYHRPLYHPTAFPRARTFAFFFLFLPPPEFFLLALTMLRVGADEQCHPLLERNIPLHIPSANTHCPTFHAKSMR